MNPQLKHTQFADYHGHGWIFRAVFKHDRKGNLLDLDDNIIRARRSAEIREGRASEGRASRARDAVRAIAISISTSTATAIFTANRARPRRSSASIATARSTSGRRLITSGNGGDRSISERRATRRGARASFGKANNSSSARPCQPDVRWEVPQTIDTIDPALVALQREVAPTRKHCGATENLGRCASPTNASAISRTTIRTMILPDLPQLVGDELLRLPSADAREPARAAEQIRRRDHSQFHHLQSAGRARRCFHARHRRHGERATAWRCCVRRAR